MLVANPLQLSGDKQPVNGLPSGRFIPSFDFHIRRLDSKKTAPKMLSRLPVGALKKTTAFGAATRSASVRTVQIYSSIGALNHRHLPSHFSAGSVRLE